MNITFTLFCTKILLVKHERKTCQISVMEFFIKTVNHSAKNSLTAPQMHLWVARNSYNTNSFMTLSLCKSMDRFLYDKDVRHEGVNN